MSQDTADTNFYAPPQAQIADPIDTVEAAPFYIVSDLGADRAGPAAARRSGSDVMPPTESNK